MKHVMVRERFAYGATLFVCPDCDRRVVWLPGDDLPLTVVHRGDESVRHTGSTDSRLTITAKVNQP